MLLCLVHLHPCFSPTIPVPSCCHIHKTYQGACQEAHSALTAEHFACQLSLCPWGTTEKGWGHISHCVGAKSQQQPYNLQSRSPKWCSSLCSFPEIFCFRASLEKAIIMIQSPVRWIQFSNSDYFHPINNKPECCCHRLPHQPHNPPQVHQGEAMKRDSVLLFK